MLAVQEFLRGGGTTDQLTQDLGISVYQHPELPLVGFKYSQIESPKTNPIVRDCRGLVLERDSWEVVGKPFRRFFNAGEDGENFSQFDWSNFTATTKEDGSLMILYHYRGVWHVNTSGSFGLGECNFSGKSWRDLFWETSRVDAARLDPQFTYIWEMWTPYNKVVRIYPKPVTFLLSMFHNTTLKERTVEDVDEEAWHLNVSRPEHHRFSGMDDITAFLREMETRDKTYEGLVIRDSRDDRFKIKTDTYLSLHHLIDNGNLFNPKRLVPLVLAGETDEVLAYIPDLKPHLEAVQAKLDEAFGGLLALWQATWKEPVQKTFALSIVNKNPFVTLLFDLRRDKGFLQTEADLRALWRESADLIVKRLYGSRD